MISRFLPARAGLLAPFLWLALACVACARPAPPAQGPAPAAPSAPTEPLRLKLLPAPQGVAPAPAGCQHHAAVAVPACPTQGEAVLQRLAEALQVNGELDRDRALAQLENCPSFAPGLIRALRSELAPSVCADVIVDAYFATAAVHPRADLKDLLFGLGIAARLERVSLQPPPIPSGTKEQFLEHFKSTLAPWIVQQAKAIHELMEQAAALRGYGRGVAAIAAGIADLRFVELTRALPLPKELASDVGLSDAYYGSLDQALEPRKARGRDAALVGLKEFAAVGVLRSARLEQARQLLSSQYAGRRVDLLDGLLLPPIPPVEGATLSSDLLSQLPTYYVSDVLPTVDVSSVAVLRALLDQGLPARYRTQLKSAALDPAGREHYAALLFDLARTYWSAADFAECAALAGFVPPGQPRVSEPLRLWHALAAALENGPANVAEMMLKGPFLAGGGPKVEALDALAKDTKGRFAGFAAFDAALLVSLNPSTVDAGAFWKQIEQRYRGAAQLLRDPLLAKEAQARAQAAAATAKAAGKPAK